MEGIPERVEQLETEVAEIHETLKAIRLTLEMHFSVAQDRGMCGYCIHYLNGHIPTTTMASAMTG